ncbi:hypothetical protein [Nocardia sp. JCM 34519.1]|uniref:hypothetical protein n=1 Tax=unclassified Nocardia TaxID=2637762 RepID=UPI0035A93DD1
MATWAKAPDFADQPARQAEVRAQTVLDKQRYLDDGMTPLRCQSCQIRVLVRKNSSRHTSLQWTEPPGNRCPVFAEISGPGQPVSCPQLQRTIEWAVREGLLEIPE